MQLHSSAIFYDGLTSKPHEVEVDVAFEQKQFIIVIPGLDTIIWHFNDIVFEFFTDKVLLQNKNNLSQTIRINDEDFFLTCKEMESLQDQKRVYNLLLNRDFKVYVYLAVGIVALFVIAYVFIIPVIGEKAAAVLPEDVDTYLGDSYIQQYLSFEEIDSVQSEILQSFIDSIEFNNIQSLQCYVVNDSIVNAFALPNGSIVVYTGLLQNMKDYTELAGLLAHEAAHVNYRHSVKAMCRELSAYMFVSLVLSDINGVMAVVADNADMLNSLSYSRSFEREADAAAVDILAENGINPRGVVQLFESIKSDDDFIDDVPQILLTHPHIENRIADVNELIAEKPSFNPKQNNHLKNTFARLKDLQ